MSLQDDLNATLGEKLTTIFAPRDTSAETYETIFRIIKEFEQKVPATHIPCVNFVVHPFRIVLVKVRYFYPDIFIFYGKSLTDGLPVHIVQHIHQLTLSLIAVPKPNNLERLKIGFEVDGQPRT